MTDEEVIMANKALLTEGDDTLVECREHNVKCRFGDLSPIAQLAVLSGLDQRGDVCIMDNR